MKIKVIEKIKNWGNGLINEMDYIQSAIDDLSHSTKSNIIKGTDSLKESVDNSSKDIIKSINSVEDEVSVNTIITEEAIGKIEGKLNELIRLQGTANDLLSRQFEANNLYQSRMLTATLNKSIQATRENKTLNSELRDIKKDISNEQSS